MTSDYIILMAREAGIEFREHLKDFHSPWCDGIHMDELKRFAALIAAAEREWVDLTATEIKLLRRAATSDRRFAELIQAKLKEKNYD